MKFAIRQINSEGRNKSARPLAHGGVHAVLDIHSSFVIRHSSFRKVAGFTLAEVLAAMLFMAIVIPAAIMALRVASRAGEVAARRNQAARIADRILNENLVTTNWGQPLQSGTITEGAVQFRWTLVNESWTEDPLRQLSVEVKFAAQDRDYSVRMSTLADNSTPPSQTGTTP